MKFKNRLIKKEDGGIEIRLSFSFTKEEVASINTIPDDPNVSFENLRSQGNTAQKVDWYLQWLRILCGWVDTWNNRDRCKDYIMQCVMRRKSILSRPKKKRRRR